MATDEKSSSQGGKRKEITSPYLLIVEGKDDEKFFEAFLAHLGIVGVQIHSLEGKDNLASRKDYVHDLGRAAQKSVWPFTSPAFDKIKDFLIRLVSEN